MISTFSRRLLICILACVAGAPGCGGSKEEPSMPAPDPPSGPSTGERIYQMRILRHTTARMDDPGAETVLANATVLLQTNDGPGDVACPIRFLRQGTVETFATGDGSIDSEAEFRTVLAVPGEVKIVNQINWCGGFKPNILGCAPTPGQSFVAVRHWPDEEGIMWAHEFGHNKGRDHREEPYALMQSAIGQTHRRVNEDECRALGD